MPGSRFCRQKRNLPGNNPSEGGTTRKQDSPGTGVPENRIAAPGWADRTNKGGYPKRRGEGRGKKKYHREQTQIN
ncbi:hypothetical protein KML24007_09580 [Alistipes indistinctus]